MRGHSKDTLVFIVIAVSLMWLADYYLFGGKQAYQAISAPPPVQNITPPVVKERRVIVPGPDYDAFDFFNDDEFWWGWEESARDTVSPTLAVPPAPPPVRPRIAVIIDDIGMNLPYSRAALDLPPAVTLAILPYAAQAADFARQAKEKGHDILIHIPMEAMNAPVSLGGMGLTTDMDAHAIHAMMERISARMEGYIGINNHMGSKFTADRAAMTRLMPYLKERGLIMIDSKTIGASLVGDVADEYDVPHLSRDVFLDHEETPAFIAAALKQAEVIARRKGHAIAIGHPKAITLQALQAWIPTLDRKNIDLVAISDLVTLPEKSPLVTVSVPASGAREPAPAAPHEAPPALYSPSPEIHF